MRVRVVCPQAYDVVFQHNDDGRVRALMRTYHVGSDMVGDKQINPSYAWVDSTGDFREELMQFREITHAHVSDPDPQWYLPMARQQVTPPRRQDRAVHTRGMSAPGHRAATLAAVTAVSALASLTGCGNNDSAADPTPRNTSTTTSTSTASASPSETAGTPGQLCETANAYVWYVTSIAGSNGVQPNGDRLKTALDRTLQAAKSLSKSHTEVSADAAKMTTYVRLHRQRWQRFDFDTHKVTKKDLPYFQIPGYQKAGEHVLAWSADTCGDKMKPFPSPPA